MSTVGERAEAAQAASAARAGANDQLKAFIERIERTIVAELIVGLPPRSQPEEIPF